MEYMSAKFHDCISFAIGYCPDIMWLQHKFPQQQITQEQKKQVLPLFFWHIIYPSMKFHDCISNIFANMVIDLDKGHITDKDIIY